MLESILPAIIILAIMCLVVAGPSILSTKADQKKSEKRGTENGRKRSSAEIISERRKKKK